MRSIRRLLSTIEVRSRQRRVRVRRRLSAERLHDRRVFTAVPLHNFFDAEDVNDDGLISPSDALAVINAMASPTQSKRVMFTDVNEDGVNSPSDALMVINRLGRERGRADNEGPANTLMNSLPKPVSEYRSFDGSNNHPTNSDWGAAGQALLRLADEDYSDGVSQPSGVDRPSPRVISNQLSAESPLEKRNDRNLSPYLYLWGQFLDHDIGLTEPPIEPEHRESFSIEVPVEDPWFNPLGRSDVSIPFTRSDYDSSTGDPSATPRQQLNLITSFIDGSQIYGVSEADNARLRSFVAGLLLVSDGQMLPKDSDGEIMAGDVRAAENIGLTAMHTLFVREHNRLAKQLAIAYPEMNDEELFQQARAIVIAELQSITYNEFLPALLGKRQMKPYLGYEIEVNAGIANEFSTAAFRFGHSTINPEIELFDNDGLATSDPISLTDAFFNPSMLDEIGIDQVLKFDASTLAMEVDLEVIDTLRNFLFGPPGAGGLDLVSLNIQRGRDHGLDDYNSVRVACGLPPVATFAQITSDPDLAARLEAIYGNVDNVDLWVGILAEDHQYGSSVGELGRKIVADQFRRLREGDRFYFENVFSQSDIERIKQTSLADIIERNTEVTGLQDNVFFFRAQIEGSIIEHPSGGPVAAVAVELRAADGEVLQSVLTDEKGNFQLDQFKVTGSYQVHLPGANQSRLVSITSGDQRYQDVSFVLT
ncbi:peroxidase family protein [Rhodopirellula sp. MGV]|uniref:peroxidase family protein n=1 Tax=Rhodopirellula sp. MGV TaxID=2023130 RepID=UPI000B966DBC|nr:peroxidase family protein [Rhodopirellula sp. MGV]OYP33908.1 hypothetical protein CGZ80_17125 [Rhodopirellula sp. MGV]PNY34110.1 peroxidase [Rhodopirellula baltica]